MPRAGRPAAVAPSMAGARNPEPPPPPSVNNNMVACQLCAKPFGKPTKLQRHLLQAHPVDVTIARDELRDNAASTPNDRCGGGDPPPFLNEDQRRADEGVQAALAAANLAMQIGNTGSGVECPQCLPDNRGRLFKNAIDLASHMISKHNIIPSDDDDDSDEEEEREEHEERKNRASGLLKTATDLTPAEIGLRERGERLVAADTRTGGACHRFVTTIAGAGPSAPASEVSEKLTDSRKRGLSIDASAQTGNEAKRTKLLCVDVSNDGAKAPAPRDIPSPALAIVPKPEVTICNLEQDTALIARPNKGSSASEAPADVAPSTPSFELGVGAAKKEATPVTADTRRELMPLARSRSPPALETEEGTKATAKKPPTTPKVTDSHRESVLSAVDAVAREILAAKQKSAGPGKRASQSTRPAEIQPTLIPVSGNPLASRAQFMTKGFDMDFTDICDFPSSVHPAYYRQAAVVENGDSKP